MKKLLIVIVIALSAGHGYCQNQGTIDSLTRHAANCTDEHEKAKTLLALGKAYYQTDYKKAQHYTDLSIKLCEKNHFDTTLAFAYNAQGVIYVNLGQHQKAASCFDSSAKYNEKTGNMIGVASVYGNMGALFFTIGEYSKSLEYQIKCLKIEETLKDTLGIGITLGGIASVYFVLKDFEGAIKWYHQALIIHRKVGNKPDETSALYNIGVSFANLKNYPEAFKYMNQCVALADSINNQEAIANGYFGLGEIYTYVGDFDKALQYCQKSIAIYEVSGNIYRETDVTGWIAEIYFKKKDYQNSIEYYQRLLSRARLTETRQYARDALNGLYRCYSGLKDFEKAFRYQSEYIALKDSILNEEMTKQLAEMQTRFETEKKEAENQLLQKQNELQSIELSKGWYFIMGLGGLFILSVIITVLAVVQSRLKAKHRTMQAESKLLRSQMNPHFIFNSLIAIESFIYRNEPKEAGRYLSGFAQLIRLILENSREEYIPLSREISTLKYYLDLQRLRFNDKFSYTINLDEGIDPENIAVPPMLAQPFIENAIEHGIKEIVNEGLISIRFRLKDKKILFEVQDNGVGISKSLAGRFDENKHSPLATIITGERLALLNRSKPNKIKLAVEELKDSGGRITGTMVSFSIPVKEIYGG